MLTSSGARDLTRNFLFLLSELNLSLTSIPSLLHTVWNKTCLLVCQTSQECQVVSSKYIKDLVITITKMMYIYMYMGEANNRDINNKFL